MCGVKSARRSGQMWKALLYLLLYLFCMFSIDMMEEHAVAQFFKGIMEVEGCHVTCMVVFQTLLLAVRQSEDQPCLTLGVRPVRCRPMRNLTGDEPSANVLKTTFVIGQLKAKQGPMLLQPGQSKPRQITRARCSGR